MTVHYHYVGYGELIPEVNSDHWTMVKIKHDHEGRVGHYHSSHPSLIRTNTRDSTPEADEEVVDRKEKRADGT